MNHMVTKVVLAVAGSLLIPLIGHRLWNSAGAAVKELRATPAVFSVARTTPDKQDESRFFREQLEQLQHTVAQLSEMRSRDAATITSLENARQLLSTQLEMANAQVRALSDIREELQRSKGELARARVTIEQLRRDLAQLREQFVEAQHQRTVSQVVFPPDHPKKEPVKVDTIRVQPLSPPTISPHRQSQPVVMMPACIPACSCQ